MRETGTLNLFYAEPDPDRWLPFDRFPRRAVRRMVRGKPRPSGHMRVFLNLKAGLDRLGVAYRVNDYRHLRARDHEVACVLGKPFLLERRTWHGPILFGPAVFSHATDDPDLLTRLDVRRVLVPGEWVRAMWAPHYGDAVRSWPVGIDTEAWSPGPERAKDVDILIYDKIYWEREHYERELIAPLRAEFARRGLRVETIRYGHYREEELRSLAQRARAMVFLAANETQGIAYQQVLSSGVPVLAWDRGGEWKDPSYYPHRVRFGPVTSVPYWDSRCGERFVGMSEFTETFDRFWQGVVTRRYEPRAYILENLTLERCAELYVNHVADAASLS